MANQRSPPSRLRRFLLVVVRSREAPPLGQFADCFEQEQQAEENLNSGRDLACMTTHKLVESRQHRVSFVAEYYYQQKRYEDRKQRDEYQDDNDHRLLRQID